ncbi:MAG: phospholipid methyltransferase [Planctomycetaceae bacterium]|nr:phospholipid methyltransferase [Planctomycetaceae bacterium]MBP61141.1 phospholipid methyltransferase [Planctomycetaceae bacterium]
MKHTVSEYLTFFREFQNHGVSTGAFTPSGRHLARALAEPIRERTWPARILEVGPGTGAVTRELVRDVGPEDQFDLVELNDRFVDILRRRFDSEPDFRQVANRTRILHQPVQEWKPATDYDFIVCGLPFNNFAVGLVKCIFKHFEDLLSPDGTLAFFEYAWVHEIKRRLTTIEDRRRIARVRRVLQRYLRLYEFRQQTIYRNFPPAVVHYLRFHKPGHTSP